MLNVVLTDGAGRHVVVNKAGELQVAQGKYDQAIFRELDTPNIGYNFYSPNGMGQFVMTGFLVYGDKQIGTSTNATVTIYESDQPDSVVSTRTLIQMEVGQNQSIPFPNIRILTKKGVYINAKTDDDDVHMTIFGHYIDIDESIEFVPG